MNLYIDKENIEALIGAQKASLYNECMSTIKKQLSVFFNFSKKDLKANDSLQSWYMGLSEGVGRDNTFTFMDDDVVPKRPIAANCHSDFTSAKLSAIYLLNDEHLSNLKNPGAVLVGAPGEELDVFNRLFLLQKDYDFNKELLIGSADFSTWQDISKYAMPLTDIIFVDSYILSDSSLVPSNFIRFLEVMCQSVKCPVNIVAYVNIKHVPTAPSVIRQQVLAAIQNITGHTPAFTLVQYTDQAGVDSLSEHDRTVVTNYVRIKSGDTYNYFWSDGRKKTKGRELSLMSLAKKANHDLAKKLVSDLQQNIDYLKANGGKIDGDKRSNFLKLD